VSHSLDGADGYTGGDTGVIAPAPMTTMLPAVSNGSHPVVPARPLLGLESRDVSAWFGSHKVLERISLTMPAGEVTALIGPSGCGKSTYLRILNRMHEMVRSAALAGEVLLAGEDIYDARKRPADVRRRIGMVFQKPNPFPKSIWAAVVKVFGVVTFILNTTDTKPELAAKLLFLTK